MQVLKETLTLREFAEKTIPCKFPDGHAATYPKGAWNPCTFEEAVEFFQKGYKAETVEFAAEVADLTRRLAEEFNLNPRFDPAETGLFFDVGRVLEGAPECWLDTPLDARPELNLQIRFDYNCYVDKEQVRRRGVVICTLINLLSRKFNLQVSICAAFLFRDADKKCFISIKIPHDPLDLDLMNFVLTHTGFFRRLGFSLIEHIRNRNDGTLRCHAMNLGPDGLAEFGFDDAVYFPQIEEGEYRTQKDAEDRLRNVLESAIKAI